MLLWISQRERPESWRGGNNEDREKTLACLGDLGNCCNANLLKNGYYGNYMMLTYKKAFVCAAMLHEQRKYFNLFFMRKEMVCLFTAFLFQESLMPMFIL